MIEQITEKPGQNPEQARRHPEPPGDIEGSVGFHQQPLPGLLMLKHDNYGIEPAGLEAVSLENRAGKVALQRGKAKDAVVVAADHGLHRPVAQAAYAVIQHDRVDESIRHGVFLL